MNSTPTENDKLSLLYEIDAHLSNTVDIHQALDGVLELMSEKLHMSRTMITIFNRRSNQILVESAYGLSDEEKERGRYTLGEGITGKVVEGGTPMVVPTIDDHPDFLDRTQSRVGVNKKETSFICVPIRWHSEIIGTLNVDKHNYQAESLEHDVNFLNVITSVIAQKVKLHRAIHEENQILLEENLRLHERLEEHFAPSNIIGNSKRMREAYKLVEKVSTTPTSVLILGESGVGKELFAHAIHYGSDRKDQPFVKVNCSALPPNLIESELFGHEKGSFTGAFSSRQGRFEMAQSGSIFLDEIGELSLDIQTKLLRVLQEREFEKVGSTKTFKADVRIIAATNRDLMQRVKEGKFREDLYYRLNVFPITIPPLRDRKTDILLLLDHFIIKYSESLGKKVSRISTPAIDMLVAYHWPGNVRELENCIERAVIMCDGEVIRGEHLPPTLQTINATGDETPGTLQSKLNAMEYELIMDELKRCNGNMSRAAKMLGLTPRKMGLRISKYNIRVKNYKNVKK